MLCSLYGFSPQEHLTIASSSWSDFGQQYGRLLQPITKRQFRNLNAQLTKAEQPILDRIPDFHASLIAMSCSPKFAIDGVNWFLVYRELLTGFAAGSNMSIEDVLALQIIDNILCQTLIVQEKKTQKTILLHMEETITDSSISNERNTNYDYRVVDATIGTSQFRFFGYPGLCFGGPAMGINQTTNTFLAVDSLYTKPVMDQPYTIWGNAIATIAFLLGTKTKIAKLLSVLQDNTVGFLDGYAVHLVQKKKKTVDIVSFEFAGNSMVINAPLETELRRFIAQPNLVRDRSLWHRDSLKDDRNEPLSLEMHRRQERLDDWAKKLPFTFNDFSQLKNELSAVCYFSPGDRYVDGGPVETGFLSSSVVSYSFGLVTAEEAQIIFGKNLPLEPTKDLLSDEIKKVSNTILPPITIHYP